MKNEPFSNKSFKKQLVDTHRFLRLLKLSNILFLLICLVIENVILF